MNDLLRIILSVAAMLLVADLMRDRFRKNLEAGQDVGIRFGDYILQREVLALVTEGVTVRDKQMQQVIEVPLTDVYMPDRYSAKDEVIE